MKRTTVTAGVLGALLLSGCAMQQEQPGILSEATEAVNAAEQSAAVERFAPVELQEAQEALQLSQRLLRRNADPNLVEHYAYIAERRAQVAEARARRASLREEVIGAQEQRQQLVLRAREQALTQAQQEARQAQLEAQALREEALQARAQLEQAEQQLAELEPQQTERGLVLTLDEVLFNFNEASLQAGNVRELDRLAGFLANNPDYNILIEGHTDAVGSPEYNQMLSEQRAEVVRNALVERGISPDRVRTAGLGEDFPVMTNATDQGRMENRRVEVVIAEGIEPPTRREAQMARGIEGRTRG